MTIHFEQLWEQCENLFSKNDNVEISSIIDELMYKLNLYKAFCSQTNIPKEEYKQIQYRTLGEILLALTHLSSKEEINVYQALNIALHYKK